MTPTATTDSILVPIDFSECTAGLVEQASDLAARLGSDLQLLHVIDAPHEEAHVRGPAGQDVTLHDLLDAETSELLAQYCRQAAQKSVPVSTLARRGAVADVILDTAKESGAAMIMMGTHGRDGVRRLLLGSVAEHVVRRAPVPVVTVRTQHQSTCTASSCATCVSHVTPAMDQAIAEQDG